MSGDSLSIAMLGTRGVPARYGGFETAVEEIGQRLVERGHRVVVYCRGAHEADTYLGMELVHLPAVPLKTAETLSHTALGTLHLVAHRCDVAILFNAANAPFLPLLRARRIPVAAHVDGLEWRRAKWGPIGRRYYQRAEAACVRLADALISDAEGIRQHYLDTFGAESYFIPYGAPLLEQTPPEKLATLDVEPSAFHLVVARFERENNLHIVVDGYRRSSARFPLLIVGHAPYSSEYSAELRALAGDDPRIRFVGAVWDQDLLNELYANATTYIHGHSVGGTNPSLLRALGAGAPVVAYDVVFNREVAGDTAAYFSDGGNLAEVLEHAEANAEATQQRGARGRAEVARRYRWDDVTDGYEQLCRELAAGTAIGPRPRARA